MTTTAKTDAELRQLAMDIANGKVFTSNHIPPDDFRRLPTVFLPLAMLDDTARQAFVAEPPGLIYQYWGVDMATYGADAYPTFFSFCCLNQEEYDRFRPLVREAFALVEGFIADARC